MSDLAAVDQKITEGAEWRGTIRVEIDDKEHELTVRQLVDPEFKEVMSLINRDELQELRGTLPDDAMETLRELRDKDELTEDEEKELEQAQAAMDEAEVDIFDVISDETFEGIRRCAKYCVEPDEEDLHEAFENRAMQIERDYDIKVQRPEDVEPVLQDEIETMIDNAVNMVSFTIGIQALVETVGGEGN
jgi:hypothetical protein